MRNEEQSSWGLIRLQDVSVRTDDRGAAYAGSQLQTQLYVNNRTQELDRAIRGALPELADASFDWRSPLAGDRYTEYWDAAFLQRLGLDEHAEALADFWPKRGGPHWDALAVVNRPGATEPGVLLAEGKSYPNEMLKGAGLGATDPASIRMIETALAWTQGLLGLALDLPAWCGPLYQNANRLAHAYWLRSRGIEAWVVHLLFIDDPHGPTSEVEWEQALGQADAALGLAGRTVPVSAHVFLPAGNRAELVSE